MEDLVAKLHLKEGSCGVLCVNEQRTQEDVHCPNTKGEMTEVRPDFLDRGWSFPVLLGLSLLSGEKWHGERQTEWGRYLEKAPWKERRFFCFSVLSARYPGH